MANQSIWKHEVVEHAQAEILGGNCYVLVKKGAELLSVGYRDGTYLVWALVDPKEDEEEMRPLVIAPTGRNLSSYSLGKLLGRVEYPQNDSDVYHNILVFHVFEVISDGPGSFLGELNPNAVADLPDHGQQEQGHLGIPDGA